MTSGIPQGSVLGLQLSNMFVSSLDDGIECKFAGNTKLCGQLHTLDGRGTLQNDLDSLDRWTCVNLINSNRAKGKDMCLGQSNPKYRTD